MELVYATLINHLDTLTNNGTLFNYSVIQLGNPQSTGVVRCHELVNGNIYTTLKIYKIVNDEYVVIPLSKYYYYIDGKIIAMESELDTNLYSYQSLSPNQIEFYLANPTLSPEEVMNMAANPLPQLSDLQILKKSELDSLCQTEILNEYSIAKQLNITNQNGYNENDLFTMNLYIAKQRSKLSLLNGMVDVTESENELDDITWSVDYDTLVDTLIGMDIPNSLDVAKLKKLNELKVWDKNITDSGYVDETTSLTLATKESDVISFTKDLTGLTSLIKESETNNEIEIPIAWSFLDINNSLVTSLSPIQYISLLNRYFLSVRNNKFVYASYLYQILGATNITSINAITFI